MPADCSAPGNHASVIDRNAFFQTPARIGGNQTVEIDGWAAAGPEDGARARVILIIGSAYDFPLAVYRDGIRIGKFCIERTELDRGAAAIIPEDRMEIEKSSL